MKRLFYALLAIPFLLLACKDKEVQCSAKRVRVAGSLVFAGYTADELDTLLLYKYAQGTGYTNPLQRDTIISKNILLEHDTAYASVITGFTLVGGGTDYELIVPATARTYRLSNILYSNDTMVYWNAKEHCGSFGSMLLPPYSATIDGQQTPLTIGLGGTCAIVLSK